MSCAVDAGARGKPQHWPRRRDFRLPRASIAMASGCRSICAAEIRLAYVFLLHQRGGRALSVIILDVDHFKNFNDTFGHAAGDEALISLARVLMSQLRPMDLTARYGGEEFIVILSDTDLKGACVAAERLRSIVSKTSIETNDERMLHPITISLGAAQLNPEDDAAALLKRADEALYRAKDGGRNRVIG